LLSKQSTFDFNKIDVTFEKIEREQVPT
jgi:hypothetical protein